MSEGSSLSFICLRGTALHNVWLPHAVHGRQIPTGKRTGWRREGSTLTLTKQTGWLSGYNAAKKQGQVAFTVYRLRYKNATQKKIELMKKFWQDTPKFWGTEGEALKRSQFQIYFRMSVGQFETLLQMLYLIREDTAVARRTDTQVSFVEQHFGAERHG